MFTFTLPHSAYIQMAHLRNIFETLYFVLQVSPAGRGGLGSNKRVAKPKYQQVRFSFSQVYSYIVDDNRDGAHQPARYLVIAKYESKLLIS